MMNKNITESVVYIGVDDKYLGLFESQYDVPNGISYNSYLIKDEKIVIMDSVDSRETYRWFENLEKALDGKRPDYIVVSHAEPDHSGSLKALLDKYPEIKVVGNAKTFAMLGQFLDVNIGEKAVTVKEGDTLATGKHTLKFFTAPMVHWPEVMVTFDTTDKIVFTADAFGKFGTLDTEEDWACEARRYYFNIVGKYGAQVQALLKKLAVLDEVKFICPLHGPILSENIEFYVDKYNTWSSYEPEDKGVTIAFGSIHGNTGDCAKKLAEMLEKKGVKKVSVFDLARDDMAEAIEDAFRYDRLVLASATYDGGMFPAMQDFLNRLASKGYKKRTVAFIENGSWAPIAAKAMKAVVDTMKDITVCENTVSFKSTIKENDMPKLEALANELAGK
ncbi:MAG: FprA family A-type flavoprotein [Clostridia bacterium]|nr:FprA family A-type flavoprotein [Clostridia bacterium]